MFRIAARTARHHFSSLIAVACAVFCAAVLVTITGVLTETGLRGHGAVGRLAGADLVVSADQEVSGGDIVPSVLPERTTVPARFVAALAALPGVTTAVGDLSFPVALVDAHGGIVPSADPATAGHGWSSTRLLGPTGIDGAAPTRPGEIALDSTLAAAAHAGPGDRVEVVADGRPAARYRVTAVLDAPGAGAYFADATATGLAGRDSGPRAGTVDLIGLRTAPGASPEVRSEVSTLIRGTGLTLSAGTGRADALTPAVAESRSLLVLLVSSLTGILLLVTGSVVASALAAAVAGQRRELALLRAVGASPAQIRRLAAAQAGLAAAVALVPGIVLGYLLAGPSLRELAVRGVLPIGLSPSVSPLPALATVVLLGLTVWLAALGAARRTSRLPATEAVAESRSEPREPSPARSFAGLLLVAAASALSTAPLWAGAQDLGAASTAVAGLLGALGLAAGGPWLMHRAGAFAIRRRGGRSRVSTWLAMSHVRTYALRTSAVTTPWAMAIVFVLTYTFAQTTLLESGTRQTTAGTVAQLKLTAPQLGGLPTGTLSAVRGLDGVRAAAVVNSTSVIWTYRQFGDAESESDPAMILAPAAAGVLDLGVSSGSLAGLTGDTVAVGSDTAHRLGVSTGARIPLILGDGARVTARVVAVYDRGTGFGPFALSADLADGHTADALAQSILIRTDGTAAAGHALAAYAASVPGLRLQAADSGLASADDLAQAPPDVWINLVVIAILLGYLLLNTVNLQASGIARRRVEIAVLRLNGMTARQIRVMMRREAAAVGAVAVAAGVALSVSPLVFLALSLLGRPWPAGPAWLLPGITAVVAAATFLTAELSTRAILRTSPATAVRAQ